MSPICAKGSLNLCRRFYRRLRERTVAVQMWLPPWMKEIGAAIGLVLSGVAFVRLVVSGLSAFVDVLTWSGVVAAAVFTLLALVGAIRPSKDVTGR